MTDTELKEQVREFWDASPCGTPEIGDIGEAAKFRELERIRYAREPFIERFARFDMARGVDVLEVGVGAGTDHLRFARSGARCFGVDLTDAAIEMTRRRLALEGFTSDLQRADAENLPFESARFDLVYAWGVIHHTPDTGKAAREILRVLKPGGRFCVMVYNRHSLLAAQAWLVFALAKGQPWRSISDVLAAHVESPGTSAFTGNEALHLFAGATSRHIDTVVTPYDLRVARRRFLPPWTAAVVPKQLGWFHVITGTR